MDSEENMHVDIGAEKVKSYIQIKSNTSLVSLYADESTL